MTCHWITLALYAFFFLLKFQVMVDSWSSGQGFAFLLRALGLVVDWSWGHGFALGIPSHGSFYWMTGGLGNILLGALFLKTWVGFDGWTLVHGVDQCFLSQDTGNDGWLEAWARFARCFPSQGSGSAGWLDGWT